MEIIDGIQWDFGPNDKIEYFDVEKSYYLTKYRPINDKEGLDFNPDWFRGPALTKLRTGKYTNFKPIQYGCKAHKEYWKEEEQKCKRGVESHGYRISGDNYFWLNYYVLKTSAENSNAGDERSLSFPMFLVYQYEYFHYCEMAELLGKDVGLLKARGLGWSEMGASLCVRPYTTNKNARIVASAFSERHLKPLMSKIWTQMDFLNDETEGMFKRSRMVKNTDMFKRASFLTTDGVEKGRKSEIEGIIADQAKKIRGDRVERLLYEEAGSDEKLEEKWIQGKALITVLGGKRVGTRYGWGTGGDSKGLKGLRNMIENPDDFGVLPFRHRYTEDGSYILTAMFIPTYKATFSVIDKRGYCPEKESREYWENERSKQKDPIKLMMDKAEYCFTIAEALINEGDSIFPKEELTQQATELTIHKTVKLPESGFLTWKKDANGDDTRLVEWRNSTSGCEGKIWIVEHPLKGENGESYENLYVGGIDSIDIGSTDGSTSNDVSDFCIVIKKRIHGLNEPKYVAVYKDRPKDPREAYQIAAKLLCYYNCKAVLESTRTAIITHFRDHKYYDLLMKRPRSTQPDVVKANTTMVGAPATAKAINHYRELLYDFIIDYWHTINYIEMIMQLLRYTDKEKRKFDFVAAMGMAELGDEELSLKKPREKETVDKTYRDFGYYIDRNGKKQHGMIPLKGETNNEYNRTARSNIKLDKGLV